jgi:hypothetical protein
MFWSLAHLQSISLRRGIVFCNLKYFIPFSSSLLSISNIVHRWIELRDCVLNLKRILWILMRSNLLRPCIQDDNNHCFFPPYIGKKICATSIIFKKTTQSQPLGENSPNLVTLHGGLLLKQLCVYCAAPPFTFLLRLDVLFFCLPTYLCMSIFFLSYILAHRSQLLFKNIFIANAFIYIVFKHRPCLLSQKHTPACYVFLKNLMHWWDSNPGLLSPRRMRCPLRHAARALFIIFFLHF